jgi:hypothetical protein
MNTTIIRVIVATLTSCTLQAIAETVSVPGKAVAQYAGVPDGYSSTIAPGDTTPTNSPVEVTGITIRAGSALQFTALGSVSYGPTDLYPYYGPDGGPFLPSEGNHPAENGISGMKAPLCSLLGVFLDDTRPGSNAPPADLDFSLPATRDYQLLSPALRQVFFIGDGRTSGGATQYVTVPFGATRLFLGVSDLGNYNNRGSFSVEVQQVTAPLLSIRFSEVEVCWPSQSNVAYQVQFRSDLTTNTWTDLGASIPGTGSTECYNDKITLGEPRRFYRVLVVP